MNKLIELLEQAKFTYEIDDSSRDGAVVLVKVDGKTIVFGFGWDGSMTDLNVEDEE